MAKEIKRMRALGVGVLQQVSFDREGKRVTYTYFDAEEYQRGKFVLGLVYWPGGRPAAGPPGKVSHLAPVIRESASQSPPIGKNWVFPPSAWSMRRPRQDSTYRGKPLWFAFDVGYQDYDQFSYEWIISTP